MTLCFKRFSRKSSYVILILRNLFFIEQAKRLVKSCNRRDANIGFGLIDIDDFKKINDLYGHPFGDCVIREIAKIGKETLRVEDVIGRIGGEEFLCILPRIDVGQCQLIARRFEDNVNKHTFFVRLYILLKI